MRTIQSRFLLRPGKELNEIIAGILGRAQRNHPLEIIAFAFASNHFHLLLWVENAERLAKFMAFVNHQLSLEVDRLYDWRGSMWSRRYQAILVSNEERAQIARLRYILSHGVKEDLVDHVLDWPGIHAGRHLIFGEPLTGYWFDRTKEYAARRRGEDFSKYTYATEEVVITSPLPCWSHLPPEKYQQRIVEMIAEIESEAAVRRRASGKGILGVKKIRAQNPHGKPFDSKKSPAPAFHAASKAAYRALRAAYSWFVASFYEAAEKLKNHGNNEGFPEGSFPPGLPFVSAIPIRAP